MRNRTRRALRVGVNDLATTHPDLAAELVDPSIAEQVTAGSNREAEWRHSCRYVWTAKVSSRALRQTRTGGCPICAGKDVWPGRNDLATLRPDVAAELTDPTLGTQLTVSSNRRVSWTCSVQSCGHTWSTPVDSRTKPNPTGCPACSGRVAIPGVNDLATTVPELASQLRDQSLATTLKRGSHMIVDWVCPDFGHMWSAAVYSRASGGKGCPVCSGQRVLPGHNDLATTRPDLADQLYDRSLASKITSHSNALVDWQCPNYHIWVAMPNTRNRGNGCPYCRNYYPSPGRNDLLTTHPELAAELVDFSLATKLLAGSNTKVWWHCRACDQQWPQRPNVRTQQGTGCPVCASKALVPGVNDLATTDPELAAQLHHPELGTLLMSGSHAKVEWDCDSEACGRTWTASVYSRKAGRGCPDCNVPGIDVGRPGYLYAVTDGEIVKVGISMMNAHTSDPYPRLSDHRRQGLSTIVFVKHFGTTREALSAEGRWKKWVCTLPVDFRVTKQRLDDGYTEACSAKAPGLVEILEDLRNGPGLCG